MIPRFIRKYFVPIAVTVFLIYNITLFAPFVRSVILRDAAVTTWINTATAPILGEVSNTLPRPGEIVGPDGIVASVSNVSANRSSVDVAVARVTAARTDEETARELVRALDQLLTRRREGFNERLEDYKKILAAEAESVKKQLAEAEGDLDLITNLVDRQSRLEDRGTVPRAAVEQAQSQQLQSEQLVDQLRAELRRVEVLRESADARRVFRADGDAPEWSLLRLDTLETQLATARANLARAIASRRREEQIAEAMEDGFDKSIRADVKAPPGSIVWSTVVGEGAAVSPGGPVISWIDCSDLLVDVPVSDAEAALIQKSMTARVIIEGETTPRIGTVEITRGSGAVIGSDDLAALAKGRRAGGAQVLLSLEPSDTDALECKVGYAAFVAFPEIGFLDILASRLRLR